MLTMGAVLVFLIGVTDGVKTFCNATQTHITSQCFVPLGGTVDVLLPQGTEEDIYKLKKDNVVIAWKTFWKDNPRYSFSVRTGIFTIKDIDRSDYATYSMELHGQDGLQIAQTAVFIHGVKTFCNATQTHITTQCFGVLGGTVDVLLSTQSSLEHVYTLKKDNVQIASGQIKINDTRYSFAVGAGIFSIRDIIKKDYEIYEIEGHNGIKIPNTRFELTLSNPPGVKTTCDARQPHIIPKCNGSLGGTVDVLLPTQSSKDEIYNIKKRNVPIAPYESQTTNSRYSYDVRTGIFTMKNIDRTEDGTFSFEIHNRNGIETTNTKFSFSIQEPVSTPRLDWDCLSSGQQKVSCVVTGDKPHYSWSLDGDPLKDTSSDITLELGRSGLLTCSVRNNLSNATADVTVSVCEDFRIRNCTSNGTHIPQWVHKDNYTLCVETPGTQDPGSDNTTGHDLVLIIAGALSAMALILILALGVCCAKKNKTSKGSTETEDVTYADVSVFQHQGRLRQQRESEVEYGEVNMAPRLRQTLDTNVDHCVYAETRKIRH